MADYQEHSARSELVSYVTCYWTREISHDYPDSHPVMPDGCIDLLFESATGSLTVVGTMTRTLWVRNRERSHYVGVRFKPGGAVPFLCDRADLLTDGVADAESMFGRAGSMLRKRLMAQCSEEEQIGLIERFLMNRLEAGIVRVEPRVAWAVEMLTADPGSRIDHLADELGLSRQYLRRLFLEHTGLSPKAFARVARLGRLVQSLQSGLCPADAAVAAAYADQSHMSHEFKALVGITPAVYRIRC